VETGFQGIEGGVLGANGGGDEIISVGEGDIGIGGGVLGANGGGCDGGNGGGSAESVCVGGFNVGIEGVCAWSSGWW